LRAEVRIARPDGSAMWAEITLLAGAEDEIQGALRDITDRKTTEAIRRIVQGSAPD
jgi:hypothetical protein